MILLKRTLSLIVAISLTYLSFGNAQAAIVSNDQIIYRIEQANDRAALLQTIQRNDVQRQLTSMGVNPVDIETRINQMTSEEVAQLNQQMAELPAGGDVLGLVVLIFIIFVITDAIGATDVFSFVHPVH